MKVVQILIAVLLASLVTSQQTEVTEEYEGSTYTMIAVEQNRAQHKTACEAKGMHLVTVNDQAEQDYLQDFIKRVNNNNQVQSAFIGLLRTGNSFDTFAYDDGTPFVYNDRTNYFQPWWEDQPRNLGNNFECVAIKNDMPSELPLGLWDDVRCTKGFWGICERNGDVDSELQIVDIEFRPGSEDGEEVTTPLNI